MSHEVDEDESGIIKFSSNDLKPKMQSYDLMAMRADSDEDSTGKASFGLYQDIEIPSP